MRAVTGQGAYLDDLKFEGVAQAVVLRSPHAHALIRSIGGIARARRARRPHRRRGHGRRAGSRYAPYAEANVQTGEPFAFAPQPCWRPTRSVLPAIMQ